MSLPSAKTIAKVLDLPQDIAKHIRAILDTLGIKVDSKLDLIDKAIHEYSKLSNTAHNGAFGIEAIRGDGVNGIMGRYYGDIVALYINRGDTYVGTIVYDVVRDTFYAMSWGDWVEKAERRGVKIA